MLPFGKSRIKKILRSIQTEIAIMGKSWDDVQNRLLVSSGRTGTQFFGELLNRPELGVFSCHEPSPDLFNVGVKGLRENQPSSTVLHAMRQARKGQLKKVSEARAKYYIESNPNFVMLLPHLTGVFQNPKVACIVRDIESYLVSALNKSPDGSGETYFYAANDRRKRLMPHDVGEHENAANWNKWDREVKVAWWWAWANAQLLDYIRDNPNAELFYFEKLFVPESGEFQRLLRFMDLGGNAPLYYDQYLKSVAHKKNAAPRVVYNNISEIAPSVRSQIHELTGKLRAELGYEGLGR